MEQTLEEYIDDRMVAEVTRRFTLDPTKVTGVLQADTVRFVNGPLRAERPARVERALNRVRTDEAQSWYKIQVDDKAHEAEVYIYDEIGYWGVTAANFVDDLNEVAKGASKITVRINSPGGDVFDGIAIGNALREHPADITVRVDALAASAASFIAAMSGGEVIMGAFAQMMIHDASGMAMGNAKDLREMADLLNRLSDSIAGTYAAKAGGSRQEWRDRMRVETWYDGPEAVKAGLADSALEPEDDTAGEAAKNAAARFDVSNFAYPGREQAPPPVAVDTAVETEPPPPPPRFDPAEFRALMERAAPTHVPDPDIVRAGIKLVANDQPAVPSKKEELAEPVAPGRGPIDPAMFYNAIREAVIR